MQEIMFSSACFLIYSLNKKAVKRYLRRHVNISNYSIVIAWNMISFSFCSLPINRVVNAKVAGPEYLDEEAETAKERIHTDIQRINQTLPLVRNIGKVIIRDKEFPKTTTKKIKRNYGGS